jgi:nucleoid DNA-binding protein
MAATKRANGKAAAARSVPKKQKLSVIKEPFSKTQLLTNIADTTGLNRKQVAAVFDELRNTIEAHVCKGGAQLFTLPGLLKVKVIRKPATKARKGINPFTGEETVFKAKPQRNVVKIQALKALKEMAV